MSGSLCALQLRDEIAKYKVGAPARVGLVAPNNVDVPAGNTGLDPSQTSFFQASLPFTAAKVSTSTAGFQVLFNLLGRRFCMCQNHSSE